ncbi:MAG: transglutaminase domain-containing protein [Bacteroidales bacterium]|nr:transglutaminase domain-containing protein [Bacteroidales bacterium]
MQRYYNLLLISLLLGATFSALAYPGEVVKRIKSPSTHPSGITFDGKNLWVCDQKTDLFYCIDTENGAIVKTLSAPGYWPEALAWDGAFLWSTDAKDGLPKSEHYSAQLYKTDPLSGRVVHSTDAPEPLMKGLSSDGNYLWSIDKTSGQIILFNSTDGTTLRTVPGPTRSATGIAYDGKYLWVSDHSKNQLFMTDPLDGAVLLTTELPGPYIRGITYDGKYLWAIDSQTDSLYKIKTSDEQKYRLTNPQKLNLTFNHLTTNFGPGEVHSLDVHIAVPESRINQKITGKTVFSPQGYVIETDNWGQKTAHWQVAPLANDEHFEATMQVTAETWDLQYFIYPEQIGTENDIPAEIKQLFLQDNEKYQITDPVIKEAVQKAIGKEKNLYKKAWKLYRYVQENMFYQMAGGWNTAPAVLLRGNGSCSEYSFVYIALCRAAGIPARYVGAVSVRQEKAQFDDVFHRWVEIFLPGYGWIPVDPSGGDSDSPAHQAAFFGAVRGKYIVTTQSGGGSNTMEWTYNSNEFYTADPKAYIVTDTFGDWDVSK